MKKTIAIVLAVALVVGILGRLAYAQEPTNNVSVASETWWLYDVSGETFTNQEVTGRKYWDAFAINNADETGAPVSGLTLTLYSDLVFDSVRQKYLTQMGPPLYEVYEWSLGDVPEETYFPNVPSSLIRTLGAVGVLGSPNPFPVTFTPDFNASCSADKTEFLQSEGMRTQTLTITLMPLQVTEYHYIYVWIVPELENELFDAVITSISGEETGDIGLSPDGHTLLALSWGLGLDTYTYTVTIEVTPKVPKVEFMPYVQIARFEALLPGGTTPGSSVSLPLGDSADELGTWTWSTEDSYVWNWGQWVDKGVVWLPYSREIIEHEPMTGAKLIGNGFLGSNIPDAEGNYELYTSFITITNPDCSSEITIDRISIFNVYGDCVYEGPLWSLDDQDLEPPTEPVILGPHETRLFNLDDDRYGVTCQEISSQYYESWHSVEIFWSWTDKKGLPLIGWIYNPTFLHDANNEWIGSNSETAVPLVNMEQMLEPGKEEKPK